jgi:leucyl-tRNA synthetase
MEDKQKQDFKEIEAKWQEFWEQHLELYQAQDESKKPKKYVLVEFPYPSGSGLHVGHAFSFTGGDVYARFNRMKGYNVLFPMGWDAFGLPTENYAIKMKRKPQEVTKENTDCFRNQMKRLAFSFDWSREVNTTDPNYYKWTQWIFVELFKKGLAYKEEMPINWCPSCKIGLANEEVVNGKCERCGAEVSRRNISQWVVKITNYADRLIEGLKQTDFIEKVKQAQINWIGKSEGARIKFQIKDPQSANTDSSFQKGALKTPLIEGEVVEDQKGLNYLEVFTTRPDTLHGVTFMVISPEHPLINQITNDELRITGDEAEDGKKVEEIKNYVKAARKKSDLERAELQKEKTGVDTGIKMINPANGKEIPLYVADYVLMGYGTGVVMGVPAHDQRDFDFAKKYDLEIIPVIRPDVVAFDPNNDLDGEMARDEVVEWVYKRIRPYCEARGSLINSENWNGMSVPEEFIKILDDIESRNIGKRESMYHLRDWIFSRQHYWGEPIPMIYCEKDGWVPVPEDQLPIRLPEVEAYEPTETGESPLANISNWVETVCPVCGGKARRETDTMPNWAGSDWYFLRYIDPFNDIVLANKEKLKTWLPVDVYIGGDEHNTLHLLYSRFIYQFLWDLGVVPFEHPEPYYRRMSHGVILGPDGQRMSKSRGNVVVPEVVAEKYGVDTIRMYLMFMGPFDATMAWNEKTLMGVKRFLDRFNKFINSSINNYELKNSSDSSREIKVIMNKMIDGVTKDMEKFGYNTAIAKMMEGLNKLSIINYQLSIEEIKTLIKLMAPLAPYLAEELWSRVRGEGDEVSVHVASWPIADKQYLIENEVSIAVAINGKVREQLLVDSNQLLAKEEIIKKAKEMEKIKKWMEGKTVVKEIYVPGRMVNLVIQE